MPQNLLSSIKHQIELIHDTGYVKCGVNDSTWVSKKPGVVAFDADGTIFDISDGDHWLILVNKLEKSAQLRIKNRLKLIGKSEDKFLQQYLSASSLYEFFLHGWRREDMLGFGNAVKVRAGVKELFKKLISKNFKIIIISWGVVDLIKSAIKILGFDNIDVYANELFPNDFLSKDMKKFIPNYLELPSQNNNPKEFLNFVKTMKILPITKGDVLMEVIKKGGYLDKRNIAIGDSWGDYRMLLQCKRHGGQSILHVHHDDNSKNILSNIGEFYNAVSYISINKIDASFHPTDTLIADLV